MSEEDVVALVRSWEEKTRILMQVPCHLSMQHAFSVYSPSPLSWGLQLLANTLFPFNTSKGPFLQMLPPFDLPA